MPNYPNVHSSRPKSSAKGKARPFQSTGRRLGDGAEVLGKRKVKDQSFKDEEKQADDAEDKTYKEEDDDDDDNKTTGSKRARSSENKGKRKAKMEGPMTMPDLVRRQAAEAAIARNAKKGKQARRSARDGVKKKSFGPAAKTPSTKHEARNDDPGASDEVSIDSGKLDHLFRTTRIMSRDTYARPVVAGDGAHSSQSGVFSPDLKPKETVKKQQKSDGAEIAKQESFEELAHIKKET